jgi:NAD(P)-dependent dehydrogenase (short-subunit alcohol dehydrogenase family)
VSEVFRLDGDIALVSGATGRLGPIWIDALLEAGARVVALDLAGAPASAAFSELTTRYPASQLWRIDGDITSSDSLERARAEIAGAWGAPTVLVNNAGVDQPPDVAGSRHEVQSLPLAEFRRMVEVNLLGTFQAIQTFGPAMAASGRGSIINIGSLYGSVSPDQRFYDHLPGVPPFLKSPAYGASKAAVANLTKYFATLWGDRNVRVNTLSPGGVLAGQDTEFRRKYGARVPLGRMAVAADLKGPLVFLASKASSYVTGLELRVDGGFTAW